MENPPHMMALSSLLVAVAINGRTNKGASVCPKKMLATPDKVSLPEVPMVRCITHAKPLTMGCKMPR